jgi:hypothetical protein
MLPDSAGFEPKNNAMAHARPVTRPVTRIGYILPDVQ